MPTPKPPKTMFVKPAEGRRVRRPNPPHTPLPEHGAEVQCEGEYASFWQRRLETKDVEPTTKEDVEAGDALALEKLKADQAAAAS